jgi:hypothetical protein
MKFFTRKQTPTTAIVNEWDGPGADFSAVVPTRPNFLTGEKW